MADDTYMRRERQKSLHTSLSFTLSLSAPSFFIVIKVSPPNFFDCFFGENTFGDAGQEKLEFSVITAPPGLLVSLGVQPTFPRTDTTFS